MIRRSVLALALLVLACVAFARTSAAGGYNYFIQFNGIEGESQDQAHKSWIGVSGYALHSPRDPQSGQATAARAGRADFHEITIVKVVDKASPLIMQAQATGRHFPTVILDAVPADARGKYLRITLTDVLITSVARLGGNNDRPTESLSLNFTKIEYRYTTQDARGNPGPWVTAPTTELLKPVQ